MRVRAGLDGLAGRPGQLVPAIRAQRNGSFRHQRRAVYKPVDDDEIERVAVERGLPQAVEIEDGQPRLLRFVWREYTLSAPRAGGVRQQVETPIARAGAMGKVAAERRGRDMRGGIGLGTVEAIAAVPGSQAVSASAVPAPRARGRA